MRRRRWCFRLRYSDGVLVEEGLARVFGLVVPVTSSCRTSRRSGSTSRPSNILVVVPSRSVRAVATTGRFVVWSRRRVNWKPMPREAGEVKIQGCTIVSGGLEIEQPSTMGDCKEKGSRGPCLRFGMTYLVRIDRAWRSWRLRL